MKLKHSSLIGIPLILILAFILSITTSEIFQKLVYSSFSNTAYAENHPVSPIPLKLHLTLEASQALCSNSETAISTSGVANGFQSIQVWILRFNSAQYFQDSFDLTTAAAILPAPNTNPKRITVDTDGNFSDIIWQNPTDNDADTLGHRYTLIMQFPNDNGSFDTTFDPYRDLADIVTITALQNRFKDNPNFILDRNDTENESVQANEKNMVFELQHYLKNVYGENLDENGIFGNLTEQALLRFTCRRSAVVDQKFFTLLEQSGRVSFHLVASNNNDQGLNNDLYRSVSVSHTFTNTQFPSKSFTRLRSVKSTTINSIIIPANASTCLIGGGKITLQGLNQGNTYYLADVQGSGTLAYQFGPNTKIDANQSFQLTTPSTSLPQILCAQPLL